MAIASQKGLFHREFEESGLNLTDSFLPSFPFIYSLYHPPLHPPFDSPFRFLPKLRQNERKRTSSCCSLFPLWTLCRTACFEGKRGSGARSGEGRKGKGVESNFCAFTERLGQRAFCFPQIKLVKSSSLAIWSA